MDRLHRRRADRRTSSERELEAAGFEAIEIRETHRVHEHAGSAIIRASMPVARMSSRRDVNLKDPQQLYLDWEHAHWAAQDVDLSRDPRRLGRASTRASATSSTGC